MIKYFITRPLSFLRHYTIFSLSLAAILIGLLLTAADMRTAAHWVLGVTALAAALPLIRDLYDDLRTGTYGVDILTLAAIITSILLKEYWTATVIVLLLSAERIIEDFAKRRSKTELDALLAKAPLVAHVVRGKKVTDISVGKVRPGDKIVINSGETVPVDAVIIVGSGTFDESIFTSKDFLQNKSTGARVLSGSVVVAAGSAVTVKATATAENSQYQQIIRLVRSAAASRSPLARTAERYSIPFTLLAFVVGGVMWAISGEAIRFLEVIVVATPGPLLVAAPIAIISGISRLSRSGIIVRTGTALERLASVRAIAFDKIGTLTTGTPSVNQIINYSGHSEHEILSYAAALSSASTHMLSTAITSTATAKGIKVSRGRHVRATAEGLSAVISGKSVLVGRLSLLDKHGVVRPRNFSEAKIKDTAAYVAVNGELAGVITFEDPIRPEAHSTLTDLKKLGVRHFLMVTGDSETVSRSAAKKLGISNFVANALPSTKLQAIESVADRPVAFIGNGDTDAPVLTAADVGIALGALGSTAASESADLVIMESNLTHVTASIVTARQTFKIARRVILIGTGFSIVLMAAFATGHFKPIYGAALQEVINLAVVLGALRAHAYRRASV